MENHMIDKLLENQYQTMFKSFIDEEQKFKNSSDSESLSFNQFKKYLYAIGMDFINRQYNSGKKHLFFTD